MQLYLKLALGNVRRSARDYSVYFATLGFAACLLYSFVASTDYLVALGLSTEQMGVLGSAGDILQAFSVFTVLVFLFLVRYANRFLLRRQLALYVAAPFAGALVHDVFGLFLVAFLAFALGAEGLFAIVAGVLAFTIGLMAVYGAITARAVERVVLPL